MSKGTAFCCSLTVSGLSDKLALSIGMRPYTVRQLLTFSGNLQGESVNYTVLISDVIDFILHRFYSATAH